MNARIQVTPSNSSSVTVAAHAATVPIAAYQLNSKIKLDVAIEDAREIKVELELFQFGKLQVTCSFLNLDLQVGRKLLEARLAKVCIVLARRTRPSLVAYVSTVHLAAHNLLRTNLDRVVDVEVCNEILYRASQLLCRSFHSTGVHSINPF